MKIGSMLGKRRQHLVAAFIGICFCLLTACETEGQQENPQPLAVPASTAVASPTIYIHPIEATRSADETRIALYVQQVRTAAALTPSRPVPTPPPPMPTPTWVMGWVPCANGAILEPERYSCWRGVVNGEILSIAAGQQSIYGDRSQSLLMIFHGGAFDFSARSTEVYSAPLKLGGMRIASLDIQNMLVSVTPYDPRTPGPTATPGIVFTFDLTTRQWVSPTPGPSPSVSVSPIPSVSPLPTQLP